MTEQTPVAQTFSELPISEGIQRQLAFLKFTNPTPIQQKAIPAALKGADVIGIAQTGTGKTLAFSIPMLERIAKEGGIGLVLLPTRELAEQVDVEIQKIAGRHGAKTAVLIGGASMERQIRALNARPNIIIATPGRLIDHLEQKKVRLDRVAVLVLDEADRMLDMGFEPQINKVLETIPEHRQTMLFSATMPEAIAKMTKRYMKHPVRIEVSRAGESAKKIHQEAYFVEKQNKLAVLLSMLPETTGPVLVFTRTKHLAKKLTEQLRKYGHHAAEIHSNRSQNQRRVALDGFKTGRYRVLVATDIAARGIDVSNIELVVNYDLPEQNEDYVHRIGRTGRAGKKGKAVSFVMPNERRDLKKIERLIRKPIPTERIQPIPALPEENPVREKPEHSSRGRSSAGGARRRFRGGRSGGGRSSSRRGGYGERREGSGGQSRAGGRKRFKHARRRQHA